VKYLKNQINFLESIHNKEPYSSAGVDINHIILLFGIILSQKPINILELGIGSGLVSQTILNAIKYNGIKCKYDALDFCISDINWQNGGWEYPTIDLIDNLKKENVNLISEEEGVFVKQCESNKYDLIISDADHYNAGEWVDDIIRICKPNGIIFCHDVLFFRKGSFQSLKKYIDYVENNSIPHYLFEKSSRHDEKCERGWLMIINKK